MDLLLKSKYSTGTSLVVQWLRIRLPMQGTQVQSLVREDPTCRGATKPMHHNYWACALEPASHNYWAWVPQLLKPLCLEPVLCNKRSHRSLQLEEAHTQQWRPNAAKKINKIKTKTKYSTYTISFWRVQWHEKNVFLRIILNESIFEKILPRP